ncbi:MAG: hypothetical protein C0607_16065 [Azoarcus sp.]|nr:MAG: hypothetical protein C0607_16065 [Azoarcus sp.]
MANEIINQTESGRVNQKLKFEDFPFVVRRAWDGKSHGSNWSVPADLDPDDYVAGCKLGAEWAEGFVDFLRDNPGTAGVNLCAVIGGMIVSDETKAARGVRIGFVHSLGRALAISN